MTIGFFIRIFFEIAAILLIGYGIIHEDEIIEFEDELFVIAKFCFKKYVLKNQKRSKNVSRARQKKVVKAKRAPLQVVDGSKKKEKKVVA